MINRYNLKVTKLVLLIIIVLIFSFLNAESKDFKLFNRIENTKLMNNQTNLFKSDENTLFNIDKIALNQIISEKPEVLHFELQLSDKTIWQIELQRYEVFTPSAIASATTENGEKIIDFRNKIANYRGKIAQRNDLTANFTFSPNNVNALLFSEKQTIVLGRNSFDSDLFILYDTDNLTTKPTLNCSVNDNDISYKVIDIMNQLHNKGQAEKSQLLNNKPLKVDIAVETDYDTFQYFKNDTINVIAYITGLYSVSSQIYERDVNTKLNLSFIHFWTTQNDPYTEDKNKTSSDFVIEFAQYWNKNFTKIKRNVANFVTIRNPKTGGMVRTIGGFCDDTLSYAYCNINGTYQELPLYSWDVEMICHENGHIFGSSHTHSCLWSGGPIDSCGIEDAGKCYPKNVPSRGTIMSYCHIYGLGLDLVFHPLCKSVIRSLLESSSCIGTQTDVEKIYTISGKLFYKDVLLKGIKLKVKPFNEISNPTYWNGNPVPGGITETVTDSLGNYSFNNLATGYYEIVPPDNYGFVNNNYLIQSPYNWDSHIVIIPGKDIQKDLFIDRTFKLSVNIAGIQNNDSVYVFIIRIDSTNHYNILTKLYQNSSSIILLQGSYTIIPYSTKFTFSPKSKIISYQDNSSLDFVATSTLNRWYGIGVVKFNDENNLFIPMNNTPISIRDIDYNIVQTRNTDDNGVFIFDSLEYKSNLNYDFDFYKIDTSRFTPNEPLLYDKFSNIMIFDFAIRNRIFPVFTNNYKFGTRLDNYSEISGDTIGKGSSIPLTSEIALPFPFKYGNKHYEKININRNGYISLGASINKKLLNPISSFERADGFISAISNNFYGTTYFGPDNITYLITTTSGISPNRVFTIEYKNFYKDSAAISRIPINFQIRLYETSGNIEFVYGKFGYSGDFAVIGQVGLRGSDYFDFNNRNVTSDWSNSSKGKTNLESVKLNQNLLPAIGLTYVWTNNATSVGETSEIHLNNSLYINPTITIGEIDVNYCVSKNSFVTLEFYDLLGNLVQTLVKSNLISGNYNISFNTNSFNQGIYYCVLRCDNEIVTKKFEVLR